MRSMRYFRYENPVRESDATPDQTAHDTSLRVTWDHFPTLPLDIRSTRFKSKWHLLWMNVAKGSSRRRTMLGNAEKMTRRPLDGL